MFSCKDEVFSCPVVMLFHVHFEFVIKNSISRAKSLLLIGFSSNEIYKHELFSFLVYTDLHDFFVLHQFHSKQLQHFCFNLTTSPSFFFPHFFHNHICMIVPLKVSTLPFTQFPKRGVETIFPMSQTRECQSKRSPSVFPISHFLSVRLFRCD